MPFHLTHINSHKSSDLDVGVDGLLLESTGGDDILNILIGELQILLNGDRILNTKHNQGSGEDKGGGKKTPLQMVSKGTKT